MKKILLVIALFIPSILLSDDSSHLINKAIVCEEGSNNFKSMYGFKFIDDDSAIEMKPVWEYLKSICVLFNMKKVIRIKRHRLLRLDNY